MQKSTRKPTIVKAYLAVFVCVSTKGAHLEVVSDLTTEAFFACLRRFVSRRGLPSEIHSDNGGNFKGARNDLQELYSLLEKTSTQSSIHSYLLSQRVQWHASPERAPHFGGLWEAAVKAAKRHLKRVIGTQRLDFEEFSTVSAQVEACLNSRPLLATTSHSPDGIKSITPGHFLIGRELCTYPETVIESDPSLYRRWTLCQAITHHFWKRWSQEYLQQLQKLQKWRSPTPNLKTGDIVVIRDDSTFTNQWPMAKVLDVFTGKDGLDRVVTLKTATTILSPSWPSFSETSSCLQQPTPLNQRTLPDQARSPSDFFFCFPPPGSLGKNHPWHYKNYNYFMQHAIPLPQPD